MAVQQRQVGVRHNDDIRELIDTHIEQNPEHPGLDEARLRGRRLSVAVIVNALLDAGGDMYVVADEYEVPDEAVRAAVYYYALNKPLIDAKMLLDAATFDADADLYQPHP